MKNFLFGLVIGIILGGTGMYTVVKNKVRQIATAENAEKVIKASQDFGQTIQDVLK